MGYQKVACRLAEMSLFAFCTIPAIASAQDPGGITPAPEKGQTSVLQEIVVTAEKRSQSVNTVPMSITAATGAQLQNMGINNVADLTKLVPSFQATIARSNPVYTLRGIGFYENTLGSRPSVGIYTDEVELPFAVMAKGATLDLERVEVLKGPQGTLFGQNVTGGLINYIAAKPTSTLRYGGETTVGRFGQGEVEGFVSGPLGDRLSIRVAARQEFGGNWQRSYTRSDGLGHRDTLSGRLLLDWRPADGVKFEISLNGWNDRSDSAADQLLLVRKRGNGALPVGLADYPIAPHDNRAADWTPDDYASDNKFRQVVLRSDIEVGALGTLTSISAYSHMNVHLKQDDDGTSIPNETHTEDGVQATASQEVRLTGSIGDRLSYIVGGNYAWYKANQEELTSLAESSVNSNFVPFGVVGSFTAIGSFADARYRTTSIFGNADYKLTDTLTAHAGIRYSRTNAHAVGCSLDRDGVGAQGFAALYSFLRSTLTPALPAVNIAPGGCLSADPVFVPGLARPRFSEHSIPFRVGLDWKPAPGSLVYANVSRGFKGGSFPVIGATSSAQFGAAEQEKLTAYEGGVKLALMGRSLQINAAGFYYDYANKQFLGSILDPTFGPLQKLVNIPKSHVLGAELQLDWVPSAGFTLGGGLTYLHTKIDSCSNVNAMAGQVGCQPGGDYFNYDSFGTLVRLTGDRFPYAPTWSGNFDAEYKWSAGGNRPFVGGSVYAKTKTIAQLGRNPALGASDPNNVLKLQAYATLDLRGGVEAGDSRWRAMVWVRNVTNKYYRVGAAYVNDTVIGWTGSPRTFGISLSFRS